jgi:hypothetical protein
MKRKDGQKGSPQKQGSEANHQPEQENAKLHGDRSKNVEQEIQTF